MSRIKKLFAAAMMIMILFLGMATLSSCSSGDSDNDGYTDSFEEEHNDVLDPDEYNWHVDNEDLMD